MTKNVLTFIPPGSIILMVIMTIKEGVTVHGTLEDSRVCVTVDLLILTVRDGALTLLLLRRKEAPFKGQWALPGRFIAQEETAEASISRLLSELLPADGAFFEQLYTFSDVSRDPRGRVISISYLVIVPFGKLVPLLTKEGFPFRCFRMSLNEEGLRLISDEEELTQVVLAFDHGRIIETGLKRLRGKIDYTDIGFRFLENTQTFSLSELQTVFEAVLGEKLDSSNFRRTILNRYEKTGRLQQTDQWEKQPRGRPAALYRIKTDT